MAKPTIAVSAPVGDVGEIKALLVRQVTGAVRWRESVVGIAHAGVDHFVEVGGKVLTGMVRKIAPDARATSLVTIEDVRAFGGEGS